MSLYRKLFNRKSLFTFDASIFFLVGIVVMVFPSAEASMSAPPVAGSLPPLEDTRRLLAALYIAVGMFLYLFGSNVVNAATRNLAAKLRGLSLFTLVGVNISQVLGGNWKPQSLIVYMILFSVMGMSYWYCGFVKPET